MSNPVLPPPVFIPSPPPLFPVQAPQVGVTVPVVPPQLPVPPVVPPPSKNVFQTPPYFQPGVRGDSEVQASADRTASQITRGAEGAFVSEAARYVPPIHELEEGEQVMIFHHHKSSNVLGNVLEVNSDHIIIEDHNGDAVIIEASDMASFHTRRLIEQRNAIFRVSNPDVMDGMTYVAPKLRDAENFVVDLAHPRLISWLKEAQKIHDDMKARGRYDDDIVRALLRWFHEGIDYTEANIEAGVFQNLGEFLEEGICRHQATIFQLMLQAVGIESKFDRGYVLSGDSMEGHAWLSLEITFDFVPQGATIKYIADPTAGMLIQLGTLKYQSYVSRAVFYSDWAEQDRREGERLDENGIPNQLGDAFLASPF